MLSAPTRKIAAALSVATLTTAVSLSVLAATAGPAAAAPTATDAQFITANEQSNLAEISIGTLAETKGQDSATKTLAEQTTTDHMTAKAKLTSVAKSAGATLPTTPNTTQLAAAAQLKAATPASFDLLYAQTQVSAHEQALGLARQAHSSTSNSALKSYTSYYIGIATMHLKMAEAEVTALGGPPTTAPAGSGGHAATNGSWNDAWAWAGGAGAILLVAGLGLAYRRRPASAR